MEANSEFEKEIISEINSIDWNSYRGVEHYDPKDPLNSITSLLNLREEHEYSKVWNSILFAFGNNHRGSYNPSILKGLPLLIKIIRATKHEIIQHCALSAVDDLYCFQPEVGEYALITETELQVFVKGSIDDFVSQDIQLHGERNKKLFLELIDVTKEDDDI